MFFWKKNEDLAVRFVLEAIADLEDAIEKLNESIKEVREDVDYLMEFVENND
jgi:hypothetical protein